MTDNEKLVVGVIAIYVVTELMKPKAVAKPKGPLEQAGDFLGGVGNTVGSLAEQASHFLNGLGMGFGGNGASDSAVPNPTAVQGSGDLPVGDDWSMWREAE